MLKLKGGKNTDGNIDQIKACMAISISDKVDFRANKITRDNEGHCITIKGLTH